MNGSVPLLCVSQTMSLKEVIDAARQAGVVSRRRTAPKRLNKAPAANGFQSEDAAEYQGRNGVDGAQFSNDNKGTTMQTPTKKVDPASLSALNPRRVKPGENVWSTIANLQAELNVSYRLLRFLYFI